MALDVCWRLIPEQAEDALANAMKATSVGYKLTVCFASATAIAECIQSIRACIGI